MSRYLLTLLLFFGCTTSGPPPETTPYTQARWPLEARIPYLKERVAVTFKSGNTRFGWLADNPEESVIQLIESPDRGIYDLSEVSSITYRRRVIYP